MTLRILVTNDDGIHAVGLKVAEHIAREIAGKNGEVITVAPSVDQSGVGHSISYLRPSLISQHSATNFSVEGSPADCVLAGIHYVMKDNPPDLILSGVNNGHNLSEDILYSGTVGAAMEGTLQGIKSIAISQCYSKKSLRSEESFEAARNLGAKLCMQLVNLKNWTNRPYHTFYNINFPAVSASSVNGIKVCKQGKRPKGSLSMKPIQSPNGRTFLMVNHSPNNSGIQPVDQYKSDSESIKQNYITITPLQADLTAYQDLNTLENILNNDF